MAVRHDKLAALTAAIFTHAGSSDDEAETVRTTTTSPNSDVFYETPAQEPA